MADKNVSAQGAKRPAEATVEAGATKKAATPPEYSIQELAAAAPSIFKGVSPDCVTAALRLAGIDRATKAKAQEVVEKFIKRPIPNPNEKEEK